MWSNDKCWMVSRVVSLVGVVIALTQLQPLCGTAQAQQAAKRFIGDEDLLSLVWVTDPQLSPNGKRVLFTRSAIDQSDPNRMDDEDSLWIVDADSSHEPVPLTRGKHDDNARWSPDGRNVVFVRSDLTDAAGKKQSPQLAMVSANGGEVRILTNVPSGVRRPVWSPDGSRIAFFSSAPDQEPPSKASPATGARASDELVITRPYFLAHGGHAGSKSHTHIWVIQVPNGPGEMAAAKQLTKGEFNERDLAWAPDSSKIYFLSDHSGDAFSQATEVSSVELSDGNLHTVATVPMFIFDLAVNSAGRVAFHGGAPVPPRSYSKYNLWVMDLNANSKPRSLTDKTDLGMSNVVTGDLAAYGSSRAIHWSEDGRWLYDVATGWGSTMVVRVDASSGAITEITPRKQSVMDFSMTPDGKTLVAVITTPTMVGDIFNVGLGGAEHRLTDVNQKLWSQLNLTEPEEIRYKSFDNTEVQGWIQKPPDFDPTKKYPMILNIHGGPHGSWGWIFSHEDQWMAAQGYVVVYINPRGSNGYGQDFGDGIHFHFPGPDFRDLMIGVDQVLKAGYIDEKKLAITGGSAGGLLTDWAVSHTNRFVVAVSQRDISDQAAWWYTTDVPWFRPYNVDFKVPPFEDPADYAARSPITFVANVHTPMMFIVGEHDHVAPPTTGPEPMFRALKFLHRPAVMIMFPREGHGIGEPWHRVERLRHMMAWFDTWIRGVPHPEYEVNETKEAY